MSKVGFIGLGIMGKPMSRNLLKAGHTLVVYDIVPEFVDAIVADGAERGKTCSDVASRSDSIITMLPDGPQVEEAMLGSKGVLQGIRRRFHGRGYEFDQPLGGTKSRGRVQ